MPHLTNQLTGKHILLAISGGIAAYKAPDIVRQCKKQGADVRVLMTSAAQRFITPLTLQAVSGHDVARDLFVPSADNGMEHIELARWADLLLIAPATANSLAKMAHGMADDLLGTAYLAATCPVAIAPAMNKHMWQHSATQDNVRTLLQRGVLCIGPDSGEQACGDMGEGRMSEPSDIVQTLCQHFSRPHSHQPSDLPRILISAGPTFEDIDPVRFIGNRSSGKMGYALAHAAQKIGAAVTLVSGPVHLATPANVSTHAVRSAADMHNAIESLLPHHELFISAAAVADYRPQHYTAQKIKKTNDALTLTLEKTADILKIMAQKHPKIFSVGFAAETENLKNNALTKLNSKHCDLIIANPIGGHGSGIGMDSDHNQASVYWQGGCKILPTMPKTTLAEQLITLIMEHYRAKNSTQTA